VAAVASTYSVDENLWGRTAECGPLEDPWAAPPEDAFARTRPPTERPSEPAEIVVRFEEGVPVTLDGATSPLPAIIRRLDEVGGTYGFGRVDMIENRRVGIKSRELYEVPGALALIHAHRALEDLTLERDVGHFKPLVEARWADLVYDGQWFGPLRQAIDAFVDETQAHVTGDVRLRFEPGACTVVGRKAESSLYDLSLATYGGGDAFDQSDAEGYVRLFGLPLKVWSSKQGP
jgi:argininosuccinate synthase